MYDYSAKVIEWKDGDTVVIDIDLGFAITVRQTVRTQGINCPEIHSTDADEKKRGFAALARATQLAPPGSPVAVASLKPGGGDKYGRYLAKITLADGRDYDTVMIGEGLAKPWDGQGVKPI